MKHNILVVEDDKGLQKHLKELLLSNDYVVKVASDESTTLAYGEKYNPDLVVLDLSPATRNEMLCEELKKKASELPIIILAEKNEINMTSETHFCADDYILKPLIDEEFLTRIKIRLHKHESAEVVLRLADLELNTQTLEVNRGGKAIQLTPQEFKLLHYLMSNKGKILSRAMILSRIWMYSSDIETRVVDVYIGYLRKKIDGEFEKKLIHSIRGFGYVIKE